VLAHNDGERVRALSQRGLHWGDHFTLVVAAASRDTSLPLPRRFNHRLTTGSHRRCRDGAQRMTYSLQEAADVAGVNKSIVFRAIKAGKVSATRNEHDQWLIAPAELHRVYPPATEPEGNRKLKGDGSDTHQSELAEATRRSALAEPEVNLLRGTMEDLRRDRDSWREQAQRLTLPAPANARSKRWRSRRNAEQNLAA
jgi:hypothetical protein